MPKISVITPVYNVETYLEECIFSLIKQTLEDIEIILVDDGSTDSSGQICDDFAMYDKRVKVVHKKNSGYGASCNVGISLAQGEYTGILESDDFADKHMFEDLYCLAQRHDNPDVIKSEWFLYTTKGDLIRKDHQFIDNNSYSSFSPTDNPSIITKQASIWSSIYRTEFLKKNDIKFLETPGASFQDVSFMIKTFVLAKKVVITPDAYVFYRQDNENSSVKSKEKSEAIIHEYEEVDRFFDNHQELKKFSIQTSS